MIPGFFAAQAVGRGDSDTPSPGPRFVGASYSIDASGNNMTLPVPAGTQIGDTLIWMNSVRGDRNITVPSGWAVQQNVSLTGSGFGYGARLSVLSKSYSDEETVTVMQSANSSYGAVLAVVRGEIVQQVIGDVVQEDATATITPGGNNTLLGILMQNNIGPDKFPPPDEAPASGWVKDGASYMSTSGFGLMNYMFHLYSREASEGVPVQLAPDVDYGSADGHLGVVWIAEVGP